MLAYTDHLMINKTNKDSSENTFKSISDENTNLVINSNCKMYVNSIIIFI